MKCRDFYFFTSFSFNCQFIAINLKEMEFEELLNLKEMDELFNLMEMMEHLNFKERKLNLKEMDDLFDLTEMMEHLNLKKRELYLNEMEEEQLKLKDRKEKEQLKLKVMEEEEQLKLKEREEDERLKLKEREEMVEKELNLKGPAVATIVEIMARYELKELHQLSDREEVLESLKLNLKAVPFSKLTTYLKKMQHKKTATHKSSFHPNADLQLPLQTLPTAAPIVDVAVEESKGIDIDVDPLLECESNASKADLQLQYESEMSIIPVLFEFMDEYELKARVMKRFERSKNRHLDRAKRIVKLLSVKYDSKPSNVRRRSHYSIQHHLPMQ